MRISEIDLYHLPGWMNAVFEQVEKQCEEELERESETYRKIIKEEHTSVRSIPFPIYSGGWETRSRKVWN